MKRFFVASLFAIMFCCNVGTALADSKDEPPPEVKKGYTLPYFFTGIAILAVVVPLCWPSLRKMEIPKLDD